MTRTIMEAAEKISKSMEDAAGALLDKLCEGEPDDVRRIAWDMFVTRVAFANGKGSYFHLPPLDEC